MRNRLALTVMGLVLVLGGARILFGLSGQRVARASYQLSSGARALQVASSGCLASWAQAGPVQLERCPQDAAPCERWVQLLGCAHADVGLPDGLAWGTFGALDYSAADSWLKTSTAVLQLPRADLLDVCAGTLLFSEQLARQGGAPGERYASRLALLTAPVCAAVKASALERSNAAARFDALQPFPLSRLVRTLSLDAQLRRFGSWMRPDDLAALPDGRRALAGRAPPPPDGFGEKRSRVGQWLLAQRLTETLALAADGDGREAALAELEKAWPERVAPPEEFRTALEEELIRRDAVNLVLAAWRTGADCRPPPGSGATGAPERGGCALSLGRMHVHLPLEAE